MKDIGHDSDRNQERDLARDPSRLFRLSVVVPARKADRDLQHCVDALAASDLPRHEWELIVVEDSSGRGPAWGRNRGIESSRAPIVAFVDADVMVHRDSLRLMLARLEQSDTAAVFGSYDSTPTAPGLVSQYRNLLHRWVHQQSAGDVESFWAGCGAVRRTSLAEVGPFDEQRYTKPEIEDVELGYRLRSAGHRIVLDPRVLCTHRKRWTLASMIATDFARRGVPWARLLRERGMLTSPRGLSLGRAERLSAIMAVISLMSLIAAMGSMSEEWSVVATLGVTGFLLANVKFFQWMASEKGRGTALASVPLHFLYNLVAVAALVWGALTSSRTRG